MELVCSLYMQYSLPMLKQQCQSTEGNITHWSNQVKLPTVNWLPKCHIIYLSFRMLVPCLHCKDTVTWDQEEHLAVQKSEWWAAGIVMSEARCKWLAYGATDVIATTPALASLKCRMILPFCCQLTQDFLEKVQCKYHTKCSSLDKSQPVMTKQ